MSPRRNKWNRNTNGLTENIKLRAPLVRAPRMEGKEFYYISNSLTGHKDIPSGSEVEMIELPRNSKDIFCTVEYNGSRYRVSWNDLCE